MILQRMASAIKRQDWFQVTVEIFIVVIGIFLGLQVSEWNQNRNDRALEAYYLDRITNDIENSVATTEAYITRLSNHAAELSLVLDSVRKCELSEVDKDAFANGLYHIGKFNPPALIRNTFEELINTGTLNILTDVKLREAITFTMEQYIGSHGTFDQIILRTIPHVVYVDARYILNDKGSRGGSADITNDDISYDFNTLCNDTLFAGAFSSSLNYSNDWLYQSRRNLEEYKTLAETVATSRNMLGNR